MTPEQAWMELKQVMDPEIPTISLVDLGVVNRIEALPDGGLHVSLIPTFAGCPALKVMETMVVDHLLQAGAEKVDVETTFDIAWTTERISDHGRAMLLKHGLAPPPKNPKYLELDVLSDVACPYCGSHNTDLRSPFGPTLCRALHYCKNCHQAFEQFKPLV